MVRVPIRCRRRSSAVLVVLGALLVAGGSLAASGDLDPSFGAGGIVSTDLGGAVATNLSALVREPDGRLVAAGGAWAGVDSDVALARFTRDGELDPTFGIGGIVQTSLGGFDRAEALAVQSNGKLVVAALRFVGATTQLHLIRYLSNGALDPSFGGNGVVPTPNDGISAKVGLAVRSTGSVVVAAARGPSNVDLVQYTPDGSLDESFGTGGVVTTPIAGAFGFASSYTLALQPDGKLVVQANTGIGVELVRYERDGTLDSSFGTGGHVRLMRPFYATSVLVERHGTIVMGGTSSCGFQCDLALIRLTSSGDLDPTFGTGGEATTDLGGLEFATGLASGPDGTLVLVGTRRPGGPGNSDFVVARYTESGVIDPSFGTNGVVTTDIGGDESARAVVLQPNGRIVAAGDGFSSSPTAPPTRFVVVRYLGG